MKKFICCLLSVLCLFGIVSCGADKPEATPEPTAEPVGIDLWYDRAERRFNMQYGSFAEYWSWMCDEFYGDNTQTLLGIIGMDDKEAEVSAKKSEYKEKYGEDWHYKLASSDETELDEKTRTDFANELNVIYERTLVLTQAAESWSDTEWTDYADAKGCTVEQAKQIVAAIGNIGLACRDAKVTRALDVTLHLEFSGGSFENAELTENNTLYEVNGVYVSEMLLDCTFALINLAF